MNSPRHPPLPWDRLPLTSTEGLDFVTTAELEPLTGVLGQARAEQALNFAIAMPLPGYHVYVMGEPDTGRLTLTKALLEEAGRTRPTPDDWIYLNHFEEPRTPIAVALPAGLSQRFTADMDSLIEKLLDTFPAVFESPSYQRRRHHIEREFNQRYENALNWIEHKALAMNVAVLRDGDAISFTPLREGRALDEAEFAQLSEAEREAFNRAVAKLEDYLADRLAELPQWRREMAEKQRELDRATIRQAIDPLLSSLEKEYGPFSGIGAFFAALRADLEANAQEKLCAEELNEAERRKLLKESYAPNLFVCHSQDQGAPVIYEPHPTLPNLFGHIEYTAEQGVIETNYHRIYAGSLHRANGGFLILEADKLFSEPQVWPALKRALKRRELVIERPYMEPATLLPAALNPKPIPLEIKVIVVGDREQYFLLQELDPEFSQIFKVLADFDDDFPRTPETLRLLARFLAQHSRLHCTAPLTQKATLRLTNYSSRLAESRRKLSARLGELVDLLCEAEWWRSRTQDPYIDARHVDLALTAKEEREGRLAKVVLEEILSGTILIATSGCAVGQVNGLTLIETGKFSFAAPARITATAYPGSKGIVDIEREASLGQAIHSKGVMILSGYLGYKYAQKFPLAISAHIAMEQSYGYIDGDSAALAEVCALISALTHIPIQQCFAVTGSLNQYGEAQAVGGINEKIEGFFRLCQARGLDGSHGVIFPQANCEDLVLKDEVIEAVAQGLFYLYPISCVDQALELLMGLPAGTLDAQGNYPENSINGKAVTRFREISELYAHEEEEDPKL